MQSRKSSIDKGQRPLKLPWGCGSMAMHGASWWLAYRDGTDKTRYENAWTADAAEAQRMLAERALPRMRGIVALLERIADGKETYRGEAGKSGQRQRPGSVAKVGAAPAAAARKARGQETREGGRQ